MSRFLQFLVHLLPWNCRNLNDEEYMTNSIKKSRKKYSAQFKFDRAMEAIKTDNLSEISRKYGVSVNLLSNWRTQLIERGAHAFETSPDQEKKVLKNKIGKLEQMLGKKEVELNLLKNFSDFYESQNTP